MTQARHNASPPPRWRWTLRLGVFYVLLVIANLGMWFGVERYVDARFEAHLEALRDRPDLPHPDDAARNTGAAVGEDNAAYWYTRAMEVAVPPPTWDQERSDLWHSQEVRPPVPGRWVPVLRRTVEDDAETLRLARHASTLDRADWGLYADDITVLLPLANDVRVLARTLALEGLLGHHDGDAKVYLASILEVQRLATAAAEYHPALITGLVSTGIDALACFHLRGGLISLPPHLTRDEWQARLADERDLAGHVISRLLDEAKDRRRWEATLRGEGNFLLLSRDLMRDGVVVDVLLPPLFPVLIDRSVIQYSIRRNAEADQFAVLRIRHSRGTRDHAPSSVAGAILGLHDDVLEPTTRHATLAFVRILTDRRASAIQLALTLYEHDHGRLPGRLDDLVPGYLPAVPVDPFDPDGLPFRYDLSREMVWSVGEDGIDDGGDARPAGRMPVTDELAHGLLRACRHLGLRVPDDVAVIGVNNDEILAALTHPPLSSVIPDARRIGRRAAEVLDALLEGEPPPPGPIRIPPLGVEPRQSTDLLAIDDPDAASAYRYIHRHAGVPLCVEDVCRELTVSRRSLERRFKRAFGRTILDEIRLAHVMRSQHLLVTTDDPLETVADRSGFRHAENFFAAFRRVTGTTPAAWRKRRGAAVL